MIVEGLLLLLAVGAGAGILESRRRLRIWKDAAVSCGLEVTGISRGWSPSVKARDGQGEVLIGLSEDGVLGVRIVVESPGPEDFNQVQIRPQPPGFVGEIDIRDLAFDGEFHILGPVLLVSSLLDEETRRLLSLVNTESRLEISSGTLRADVTDGKVARVLPRLLDLRTRFAMPLDIPRRLAENVMRDPVPGVRVHNLLLLMNKFPDAPETAEALHAIRWDPSSEARLRIGIELGTHTRGRDLLERILAELEDDAVSARALSFLSGDLPFERIRDILERALSRHCRRTASTCLEVIGASGNAAAVEVLAKVLDQEHGNLAPVVARALGATGSPAAEPPLIQTLERDHSELQEAAAKALGRVGSAAAVLPLKELADRSAEIRQTARQAIAEIQSRIQGGSPGQLSLAGAEAGQLSLATDPAGQLSISGREEAANELKSKSS